MYWIYIEIYVQIGAEGSHCHKVMSENFRCLGVLLNNVQPEEPNLALFVQFIGCKEVKGTDVGGSDSANHLRQNHSLSRL